jgi:hypothetical protein
MSKHFCRRSEVRFTVLVLLVTLSGFFVSLTQSADARLVSPIAINPAKVALEKKPAKKKTGNLNVSVTFDQTHYTLAENGQHLVLKTLGGSMQVSTRGCSKPYAEKIKSTFRELESRSQTMPHKIQRQDVIVVEGKQQASIGRGSEFGEWLRDLPAQFPSLVTESRIACAH